MKKQKISTRQRIESVRQYRLEYILAEDQAAKAAAAKAEEPRQEAEESPANYETFISAAPSDPATQAAIINERYGYSTITAVNNKGRNVIVEHLHRQFSANDHFRPYRIKITQYLYYNSMEDVRKWAAKEKITLQEFGDHNSSEDMKAIQNCI